MQVGTTLGRRFTLVRPLEHALEGVERWIADDTRLAQRVTVDLIRGESAATVRLSAAKAAQVRDARFARIVSTGRHSDDDGSSSYVVSERPRGVRADALLGSAHRDHDVAASLVGDAARALEAIRPFGVSHGALSAASLVVSPAGRVIILGLGVDGPMALDAGLVDSIDERADAAALSRMYLEAVTGSPAADVTAGDVPQSLGTGATALAHGVIANEPPTTLRALINALGPTTPGALRRASLRATSPASPSAATPASEPSVEDSASPTSPVSPASAGSHPSAPTPADELDAHAVAVSAETLDTAATAVDEKLSQERLEDDAELVVPEPRRPRTPDPKLDPLLAWEGIVDAQNSTPKPSVVEAVLGGMRKLAPNSEALESAHVKAHARAHRTAPLNVGPLLVALTLLAVVLVVVVSWEEITEPFSADFDLNNNPANSYPTYTYSPEPYPTASPSPSE